MDYSFYMELAIEEAKKAFFEDEIPVGAIVIGEDGELVSRAHNRCIATKDPTAHAEILALREAGLNLSNYRLTNCVVVCTLEPCIMCMGALINARVKGLVFGTRDPKAGAVFSKVDFFDEITWVNHKFWIREGILAHRCSDLLKRFFKEKRKKSSGKI